jgi:hypothetical protein
LALSSATATYLDKSSATATYLSKSSATATYQPIGSYLTTSSATATYLALSSATATYLDKSSATATYLSKSSATATYQPIGSYLTTSSATANYIRNMNSLQSGATFYVSSGTVDGQLTINSDLVEAYDNYTIFRSTYYYLYGGLAKYKPNLLYSYSPIDGASGTFQIRASTKAYSAITMSEETGSQTINWNSDDAAITLTPGYQGGQIGFDSGDFSYILNGQSSSWASGPSKSNMMFDLGYTYSGHQHIAGDNPLIVTGGQIMDLGNTTGTYYDQFMFGANDSGDIKRHASLVGGNNTGKGLSINVSKRANLTADGTTAPEERMYWEDNCSSCTLYVNDHIVSIGSITATTYFGDGSNLTGIESSGSGASSLQVLSEGVEVSSPTLGINFVGAGVSVALNGTSSATVTIPGGEVASLGIYNVIDYGAVGDGATDDQAAFQDAIDAAFGDGGGLVHVPQGTYKLNTPIDMKNNVTMRGDGRPNTTLDFRTNSTIGIPINLFGDAVTLRDFTLISGRLDGNPATGGYGIGYDTTDGDFVKGATNFELINVEVIGNRNLFLLGEDDNYATGNITNCIFRSTTPTEAAILVQIYASGGSTITMRGCDIYTAPLDSGGVLFFTSATPGTSNYFYLVDSKISGGPAQHLVQSESNALFYVRNVTYDPTLVTGTIIHAESGTPTYYGMTLTSDLNMQTNDIFLAEGKLSDSSIVTEDIKNQTITAVDLSTMIAITSTGEQDYGNAASFEIPNSTNSLLCNATGEIALNGLKDVIVVNDGVEKIIPLNHIMQGTFDLAAQYDVDTDLWLIDLSSDTFPAGIVITKWYVDASVADPTTELNANLMYCDAVAGGAFPGANPVLIDVLDTTTGNSSETNMASSDLGSGVIPTTKSIYIDLDADPTDANTVYHIRIHYYMTEN